MTRSFQSSAIALVLVILLASPLLAQPAAIPLPRLALDDVPTDAGLRLITGAGSLPFPVAIRLESPTPEPSPALTARLDALERRNIPVWLSLPSPQTPDEVDRWRVAIRSLLDRRDAKFVILEIAIDQQPAEVARFAVQAAATEVGASARGIRIALGGDAMVDPSRRTAIYAADLAPYVDLLAVPSDRAEGLGAWLQGVDIQAGVALRPSVSRQSAPDAFLTDTLEDLGSAVQIRAWRSADVPAASLRALAPLAPLLTHLISALDDEGARVSMTRGGVDVTGNVSHRLLFDTETFSTYLVYQDERANDPLTIGLNLPVEGTPGVLDVSTGARLPVSDYNRDAATGRVRANVPRTGHPMLVGFNVDAAPIGDRSEISAARTLSVGEIIARHQQQQRAQDAAVKNYVAHARMEQHFRPTIADPGYDVVAENTYFSSEDGVEWEELQFSVNGSTWGADRPPFPILQPEKVLALPLQLRFDEGYRYQLSGTERVNGFDCYAVKFEPVRQDSALYRGTVWIDQRTFARIRVQAVQSGLAAPVVSNEEVQQFAPVTNVGNLPVFLFTDLTARQIILVAGRNLLVEKRVAFSGFRVNDTEFERRRASARESDRVMFRETAGGLRYYAKENGRRVISDRPTLGVRALAMGVTLDPSYGFPLPIFGINYLDFQFGRPDTQLALLFAGVLAAGNIQRSNFGAKSVDASVDFFAIAAPSSDRLFGEQGEDPSVRVLTWPLSSGLNVGWQATPYQKATLQYQLRFDAYVRDRTTSETFLVPSSTVTNGIGGAWEYRRGGYSFVSNGAWFMRANWKAWGGGTTSSRTYAKYNAGLSRDFYLNPFQKLHLNASWFGGRDLDRFNKYQFGIFDDTRIHGVPASGVRFGELAMTRGTYSVNVFEQYRLDLFVEHAWGREEPGHGSWLRLPGVGLALNVRAPWNTILRADVGKSVLPAKYNHLGSTVVQIMLLKPLR